MLTFWAGTMRRLLPHLSRHLANVNRHRRKLPWRGDAPPFGADDVKETEACASMPEVSPYGTWVSEIMAQQTRIATVIDYWLRWMKEFPNIAALAEASEEVHQFFLCRF